MQTIALFITFQSSAASTGLIGCATQKESVHHNWGQTSNKRNLLMFTQQLLIRQKLARGYFKFTQHQRGLRYWLWHPSLLALVPQ